MPFHKHPILIELITETGIILISHYIRLNTSSTHQLTPFKADIPYQVTSRTRVRLTISN